MRRLATLLVVAVAAVGCTKGGEVGPEGPTGLQGQPGPNAAFKTVSNLTLTTIAGSGVTNILSISVTAPSDGFVNVHAVGYCNAATSTTSTQWSTLLGTASTTSWTFPQPLTSMPGGNSFGQFPIQASQTFAATAGLNTYYFNFHQINGTSATTCAASMTAFFTAAQLP